MSRFWRIKARILINVLYGICGSRNSRRFGRRATDLKNGNAGPKLHWSLWEKCGFSALLFGRDLLGPILNFYSLTVCS